MAFRSFKLITVTTATTPVRVTVNESVPAARVGVQTINVYALAGNSGANIYLGSSTAAVTDGTGIYAAIPKGTSQQFTIVNSPAGFNAADLYLVADTNGDKAIVSAIEQ